LTEETKSQALLRRREQVVARGVVRLTDLVIAEGSGATLRDFDGHSYIDLVSGIGVSVIGHGNAAVARAIANQANSLIHGCFHLGTYEPYVELCEKLVALSPHGPHTKALLLNTGAEAIENAIKIARQATGKSGVVCYTGAFHGHTLLGMTLTSNVKYKQGCGPFAGEIYRLPYPSFYQAGDGLSEKDFVRRELRRFRDALGNMVAANQLAAVVIEPVLGEGGVIPCPLDYLRGLRHFCSELGVVLIVDEIQAGFFRTGPFGSYQHSGIIPDLSVWAKAIGGGLPLSAVLGNAELIDKAEPFTLGSTFAGNPVACAAALATLDEMQKMDPLRRASEIGDWIQHRVGQLAQQCSLIGDIRGVGALQGFELVHEGQRHRPAGDVAISVVNTCFQRGVLLLRAGAYGNVIRMLPPLTITDQELEQAFDIIEEVLVALAAIMS
jgi:4-aminobutyrate aminotransferase / (S)-3-amino-2-methylpropionate transaminase / 5-aminovalerate transaminase